MSYEDVEGGTLGTVVADAVTAFLKQRDGRFLYVRSQLA